MRRYSTIHPLYMSFYSKDLYRDVAVNWKKISFLYLFLLLSICEIPMMFRLQNEVSDYMHKEAGDIVKQVPVITITKGIASAEVKMPYVISDPKKKSPLVIIDTTGNTSSLEGTEAFALITKSEFLVRRTKSSTWRFELSGIDSLVIDNRIVYDWIEAFVNIIPLIMYPVALFFSFGFKMIQAMITALVGLLFAKNLGLTLSYPQSLSLSIISMTPSVMLGTLHDYSGISTGYWWFVNIVTAAGYLWFGIKSVSEQPDKEIQAR